MQITHPDCAALVARLFACGGKRGRKNIFALRIVAGTGPWLKPVQYERKACPLISAGTPKAIHLSLHPLPSKYKIILSSCNVLKNAVSCYMKAAKFGIRIH